MEIGYITFSSEEQQMVHGVIQQITQGAIDELGLGRIRDAFSDAMFPGMSTLHRKSKYFVLLPAMYDQLSKTSISEKSNITSLIREYEITMTISLLNGVNGFSDNTGITGSSLGIQKLREGQYVKVTPTNIYLSALKFFGLVDDRMSLSDLIYQQSKYLHEHGNMIRRTKDEITEDPDGTDKTSGRKPNFIPFPGYDFSKEGTIDLRLTESEASILRSRIIEKCRETKGADNLYSYLLSNDNIEIKQDFFEMKGVIDNFPKEKDDIRNTYDLAYDFSLWAHLMNSYYRIAFYQHIGDKDSVSALQNYIENNIIKENNYPNADRISEILNHVNCLPNFHDVNNLCDFCKSASILVGCPDKEKELINLITRREKKIKGSHYKIGNVRYKNTDFSGNAGYYSYRWNEIVYSMIYDIRNPKQ